MESPLENIMNIILESNMIPLLSIGLSTVWSSANWKSGEETTSFISLTKSTKKMGPRTEPWGTPEVTEHQSETAPLNTTCCFRCERKFWIHWRRKPLMPLEWSFVSNRLWSTLSNAELKSKKIPSTRLHLRSSRVLQRRWKNLTNICSQFVPLWKPNWLSDKIPCSSTYLMIRIEINFSITLHKTLVSETGR